MKDTGSGGRSTINIETQYTWQQTMVTRISNDTDAHNNLDDNDHNDTSHHTQINDLISSDESHSYHVAKLNIDFPITLSMCELCAKIVYI